MRKIYCSECKKCKEFRKPKIPYICDKTLFLCSICNKCGNEDEKNVKRRIINWKTERSWFNQWYVKYQMNEENISLKFRLKI